MDTTAITTMSNAVSLLLQSFSTGNVDKVIDHILDQSPETSLYIPDEQIECRGWKNCRNALIRLGKANYGYIDMTHSSAWKQCSDSSIIGHWNTYTYQFQRDQGKTYILYSYWRITAKFINTDNTWKMRSLSKIKLLHVDPWDYDPCVEPGLLDRCETIPMLSLSVPDPQDFVEIRNLAGHFAHDGLIHSRHLFALDAPLFLDMPDLMAYPVYGREQVMNFIDQMERKENINNSMYIQYMTLCTPVINIYQNSAQAAFFGHIINIQGPGWGIVQPPYQLIHRLAYITMNFIRENHVWKITGIKNTLLARINTLPFMNMHHDGSDGVPGRIEYMSRIPNRNFAPSWSGRKNTAEDIFQIESILPQWTERLKRSDLPDFPDMYMTNHKHDLAIELSSSYYGYDIVKKHCNHLINEMYEGHETMWNNPQFHTGSSPVIEISSNGLSAKAWYIDKSWGNIGASVFYNADVIHRQYYPGFGTYCHELVKENGQWRLWHFGWTPTIGWMASDPYRYTYNYTYGQTGGWSVRNQGRPWPLPFENFHY